MKSIVVNEKTFKSCMQCADPHCDATYHNFNGKRPAYCKNCGMRLVPINFATWKSKFSDNFFQMDWETEEFFRPTINEGVQLE